MIKLGKYSFGIGDRFTLQGKSQLAAIISAAEEGLEITPVWNKSNREHIYVGTTSADTRKEADEAVKALKYRGRYFVDADHINKDTVSNYVDTSDFFTLDVANYIGKECAKKEIDLFVESCRKYIGQLNIPGIKYPLSITKELLHEIGRKFLIATQQASEIYAYLEKEKGKGNFITEVSMDEVDSPQTPKELLFILKMLADKCVFVQTIAPKFTGRFNKGIDYSGILEQFSKEFEEDILIIDYAIKEFGLPYDLKLSVHSGSDKFSIYPIIQSILIKYNKVLHVKTAGTTWLEEIIGLSVAGGGGLKIAKKIYENAFNRREELCTPYADVIDIDPNFLPSVKEVNGWSGEKFSDTLRHIPDHPEYNPNFRQLIHVAYPVAAQMGDEFRDLLIKHADIIGAGVKENIYERHLKKLFYK